MLVKLPWGDYVRDEAVSAITVDRSGVGFVVCVSLAVEGMEVRGPAKQHASEAHALANEVAHLISPVFCQ